MEKKVQATRSSVLLYSTLVLAVLIILALVLANTYGFAALGLKRSSLTSPVERSAKNIPVVENYYAKNWDYRARNGNEQILVIAHGGEALEKLMFRISCSLALAAHMGFAPPLILVESGRLTDSPASARDVPELIQDIFPKLRVISLPSPRAFVQTHFPDAMFIRGSIERDNRGPFAEFPPINSSTIVIDGDWESWKYTEDYKQAIFDHLEFHPMMYHYSRKTYPVLYDRKTPVRGIVLGKEIGNSKDETEAEVREFLNRNRLPNEKIMVFSEKPIQNPEIFGEGALIVHGECPQVVIYSSVFCRELLIDSSLLGWWAGMHAYYRGREIRWMGSDEGEHFLSPHWSQNKKKE